MYIFFIRFMNRILSIVKLFFYKITYGRRIMIKNVFNCKIKGKLQLHLYDQGSIKIGSTVSCVGPLYLLCDGNGIIEICNNVYFNHNVSITAKSKIFIGANCMFGNNVVVVDHDHDINGNDRLIFSTNAVIIEENCWIGANVTITKGVKIGANSVIAANSVVTRNVNANALYAGVPAKFIRSL